MEVTDVNFHFLLPTILKSIAEAAFVAIDIEMSGISTRLSAGTDRQHDHGKPTLQKQYEDSKLAAEKYQILQLGITCVEEDRKNGWYVARPYNINMSPLFLRGDQLGINRDITLSSSAMHFLLKNNFDIGTVFKRGVPYLSRMEEAYARQKFSERQDVISNIPDLVIEESNQAGWDFYRSMKKQITEWLADPKNEMDCVNIGAPGGLSGFQRRIVHQTIRNEFPACRTFGRNDGQFMQVEMLDKDKEERMTKMRMGAFEAGLAKQIGIRYLIEALAGGNLASIDPKWFSVAVDGQPAFIDLSAKEKELDDIREALKEKPRTLVGHNLFTDLIFIYKTFIGNLPDKVTDFSKLVHEIFPQVIDTKYLSTYASGVTQARSGLKPLFDELQHQIEPVITLAMEHMDYLKKARDHEAGYDSWMTAQIFLKLSVNLAAEQSAAKSRHNEILRACYENDLHMLDDQLDVLNPPNTDGPNILVSGDPPVEEEEEQSENSDMEEGEIVDEGLLIDISCHDTPQAGPEKKTAKVPHFIPHLSGPFWRRYANRLRVYGTEAEVCNLESESA